MNLSSWLSLFAVCLLGAMSPGPSLAMVIKHCLAGGRVHGLATAWAHAIGISFYAILTMIGLSIVLHQVEWLFQGISYCGAAYLAWLGWEALRSNGGGIASTLKSGQQVSVWQAACEGLLISLLNPKIALFFIALFSQFIALGHDGWSRSVLVLTPWVVDGLWYTLITLFLSTPAVLERLKAKAIYIDRISGVVLIGLACRVVTTL